MTQREYNTILNINAKLGSGYSKAFRDAQSELKRYNSEISAIKKTVGDISEYKKQQDAIQKNQQYITALNEKYKNAQTEMEQSGKYSSYLADRQTDLKYKIQDAEKEVREQNKVLEEMKAKLNAAGISTENVGKESSDLKNKMGELKKQQEAVGEAAKESAEQQKDSVLSVDNVLQTAGILATLKKIADAYVACAKASIDFESAMAGVSKTTDMSSEELAAMSKEIKQLSTQIPITTTELAAVAETAGQLGIAKNNLLDFSTVMSMLSTATTMTASDAATMLAQFANITQMNPSLYSNLASAIVDLGNNTATTEQRITEMAQGIAASASIAGMSEADMLGLSAAVTSLGNDVAAGSTSMNKFIQDINRAVETGEGIETWASVANMSIEDFKQLWGTDAVNALQAFIVGLNDTERNGKSMTLILDELGISETRQVKMIQTLATSGSLMSNAIATANKAWSENTALITEANKRYATTESQLTMMKNSFNNMKIAVGDALLPALQKTFSILNDIFKGLASFFAAVPGFTNAFGSIVMGLTATIIALTTFNLLIKLAKAGIQQFIMMWNSHPILLAASAIIGLTVAIVGLVSSTDEAEDSGERLAASSRRQYKEIQALTAEYNTIKYLFGETSYTAQELSWKIQELTSEYNTQKKTIKELQEQYQEFMQTMTTPSESYEKAIEDTKLLYNKSKSLIDVLNEFTSSGNTSAETQASISSIVKNLNSNYSDLGLTYDANTNSLNMTISSLDEYISKIRDAAILTENYKRKSELDAMTDETSAAYANYQEILQAKKDAYAEWSDAVFAATGIRAKTIDELASLSSTLGKTFNKQYTDEYNQMAEAADSAAKSWGQNKAALWVLTGVLKSFGFTISDTSQETEKSIYDIKTALSELNESYKASYNDAYESISGQMKLFDTMSYDVTQSSADLIAALQSQTAYMAGYMANYKKAAEMGLSQDVLTQLSDGSKESAAYLQAIVDGGKNAVDEINSVYSVNAAEKEKYASEIAAINSSFPSELQQIQSELATSINSTNFYSEAFLNAQNTMQGYIDGATDMLPYVKAAFAGISPNVLEFVRAYHINSRGLPGGEIEAYADGTNYSVNSFIAGDGGPELIMNARGSKVFTAQETQYIIHALPMLNYMIGAMSEYKRNMSVYQSYQTPTVSEPLRVKPSVSYGSRVINISLSPVYQISDTTDRAEIQSVLDRNNNSLKQLILDTVNEATDDDRRRSYS